MVFATRPDTIPSAAGYLRADPVSGARWRARLPDGRKNRPGLGAAIRRTPTIAGGRCRRRRGAAAGEWPGAARQPPGRPARPAEAGLADLSPLLTDYAETAALVANLDLVLTVDTSVAHVAGALGVPCWVMLPFAPDWRWMLGRDDTPWYASLRLFRQPKPGDWDGVIDAVAAALDRDGPGGQA